MGVEPTTSGDITRKSRARGAEIQGINHGVAERTQFTCALARFGRSGERGGVEAMRFYGTSEQDYQMQVNSVQVSILSKNSPSL